MNDNDIIKALEDELKTALTVNHRFMEAWDTENPDDDRFIALLSNTLKLINRQKAQIDILCNSLHVSSQNLENMTRAMPNIAKATRIAAIKEFAKKLKEKARMPLGTLYGKMVYEKDIDNLVKEMTEDKNA